MNKKNTLRSLLAAALLAVLLVPSPAFAAESTEDPELETEQSTETAPSPALPEDSGIPRNPYDSEKFTVNAQGFLTYQDSPCYVGVDVSSHQKEIDWNRVAAAGVDFAMIRAGFRGYTAGTINKDQYFQYNIEHALEAGLDVGVYFFSQAITPEEAQEEALQLLSWIRDYKITYPVVFDWERISEEDSRTADEEIVNGKVVTACAQTFCQLVAKEGYTPMTYGSPRKLSTTLDLAQLQDYPFWLAHYTKDWAPSSFQYKYHMWQYSSSGQVDGIQTRVDLDICMVDWDNWDGKKEPEPERPPSQDIVPGQIGVKRTKRR